MRRRPPVRFSVLTILAVLILALGSTGSAEARALVCRSRDLDTDEVFSIKAPRKGGGRALSVTLQCGNEEYGWRHIKQRGHVRELGWDDDFFQWAMKQTLIAPTEIELQDNGRFAYEAPIWQIFYDRNGSRDCREYDFTVVMPKTGIVTTAFGRYRRTAACNPPACR